MKLQCSKCLDFKDPSLFRKRKALKRGYESACKACQKLQTDKWREENKERYLKTQSAYQEQYRQENRLKNIKYQEQYNTQELRLKRENKYQENKEEILTRNKNYRQNNKQKMRAKGANYRALKLAASPFKKGNKKKYNLIVEHKLTVQFYKECPKGFEVDHIIPLTRGGLHCINNLQYLEAYLNHSKHNLLESEWADPRPINCIPYLSCPLS
jgi:hypothetical protein